MCACHKAVLCCVGPCCVPRAVLCYHTTPRVLHSDNAGATPLMLAVEANSPSCIKWLLEKGANPKAALKTGWHALHLALRLGHGSCVLMLLQEVRFGVCFFGGGGLLWDQDRRCMWGGGEGGIWERCMQGGGEEERGAEQLVFCVGLWGGLGA